MPKRGQLDSDATADSKRQRQYNGKPSSVKDRAARNGARAKLMQEGRVHKGDGMDVDHKNHNPRDNSKGNLRVRGESANSADNKSGYRKGGVLRKKSSSKKVSTFDDLTAKGSAAIAKSRKKK